VRKYLKVLAVGCLAVGFASARPAMAVSFSPSQAELFNVVDVTVDFNGGGSLFTGAGTAFGTVGVDAVRYDLDFIPGSATDGFSRVVLENQAFVTDLTGFSSLDILFKTETLSAMSVKTFVRTGASGFFESLPTPSNISDFDPTRVTIDLSSVPNLNDVRGFGIQMFVPGDPTAFAQTALVQTAPQFVPTQLIPVATIDSFERATLAGGATGDGWAYAKFEPGPTESDTVFSVTTVGATDGTQAAKLTRAAAPGAQSFEWSVQRVWTSTGDGRPVAADATNDAPNDTEVPLITQPQVDAVAADFNQATHLAFDVTYDPADFDPTATFANLAVHINEGSGAFYQIQGIASVNPQSLTGPTTISVEVPFANMIGFNSGLPFGSEGVLAGSDTIILGFATNIGNSSSASVAGAVIIDNLRLLEEVALLLAGDLNGDGFVGVDDLNIVLLNWNLNVTPGDLGSGDATGEGFVGVDDLNVVLVNWNSGTPPNAGAAIPEPTTLALVVLGAAAVSIRRR